MTIPSQFAIWLAVAERDGHGGAAAEPPAISRGRKLEMQLSLAADPVLGNWTTGSFAARLHASPGASGDPLAEYDCTTGTPAGGMTPVALVLAAADQDDLPPANAATGLAEVFLEVVYTFGADEKTIISTRQLVREVI